MAMAQEQTGIGIRRHFTPEGEHPNIGVKGVPAQASACQPYDALVTTPEGLIPIGRLVETGALGTKVDDAHGVTKIIAVKANGRKPVLRLHTRAGYTLDVTPDHLVW